MAFFDDLGKKLSQAGQTAIQKTKDMTDVARINGAIAEEEKKVNNTYFQIGKLYVAKYTAEHDADFAGMIAAIQDAEAKIRDYKQQVQDIKGVVRCEKCGAEVPRNTAFCSACGAQMTNMAQALIRCEGCGAMISKDLRFCTTCGNPVMAASVQAEPVAQPAGKVCPSCQAAMPDDVAFCTKCGSKLD